MASIVIPILLASIAAVETGGNPAAIGAHRERSAYQMTAETWRMHAKPDEPFSLASAPDGEVAARIAEAHIIWLTRELERAGVPITVETLAMGWNMGAHAAIKRRLTTAAPTDYAERVANIYADLLSHRHSNVPAHLKDVLPPPPKLEKDEP